MKPNKTYFLFLALLICSTQLYAQHLSVQTAHSSTILDLEYSPDGKYLVSAGMDNKVIIWDLRSYRQMNILSGHNGPVSKIAFHPNKNIIATASDDKTVKLWEYPSGKLIKSYDFFTKEVKSVAFKPDGTQLACGSDSVYLINLKRDSHITIKKKARRYFNTVAYCDNDLYLAFGGRKEFKLYLYSFKKYKIVKDIRTHSNEIFIDNKKYLYSAGNKGNIRRIALVTRAKHGKFNLTSEHTWNSFFSLASDDKLLYASNKDGLIYVYNKISGKRKDILKGHQGQVKAITISPDKKYMASAGDDKKIALWDLKNKRIVTTLEGGTGSINSISFTKDGKQMFIAYDNSNFRIWDLDKKGDLKIATCPKPNAIKRKFRNAYYLSNSTKYLPNEKVLVKAKLKKADKRTDNFLREKEDLLIYNRKNNKTPILLTSNKNTDYQSFLIKDSSNIVVFENKSTHSQKFSLLNWERIRTREQVFSTYVYPFNIDGFSKNSKIKIKHKHKKKSFKIKGDIYFKTLSEDGNKLLVLINKRRKKSKCEIYDIEARKKIKEISFEKRYSSAGFSQKNKLIYFASNLTDSISFYKFSNLKFLKKIEGRTPITFMYDDQYCAYTDIEKNLYLYDLVLLKEVYKVPTEHITAISSIKFNHNYKYLATAGYDGIINLWDFNKGEHLVSLAAFNDADYMYVTKDNYYYATVGSMDYINFLFNEKLYTFEQFDVKYNRPDTVLSKLPYSTKAEIAAYKKAYKKRIKKMGFNNEVESGEFKIPKVTISNLEDFPISTINEILKIKITANDDLYYLKKINIWVNDVPLYGKHGFDIKDQKTLKYDGKYQIQLSPGKNKIQISATNIKGYESLKETFYIQYEAKKTKPDLYFVSIGVSKYQASEYNLEYAAKDAADITSVFNLGKKQKRYNKVFTTIITDKDATKNNILKVKENLKKSTINDVVIVFYAGHGILDWDMDYYLATNDIDFIMPSEKGLKYDLLEGLLQGIPARKKMLLIDACHSGEVDKDDDLSENNSNTDNDNNSKTRGAEELAGDKNILGQSSFELMKNMFADIRKGTGSTIISSAGGSEYAYESDKTKNGIFTYILINGIRTGKADKNKDGKIMVSELRDYLMDNVSKLTKGHQNPTCRRLNLEFDFRVW